MKKIILPMLVILMAMGSFTVADASTSQNTIYEMSDIKISINGTVGKYSSTPIMVNKRVLLPLRELLTNLGVSNDEQHIIWDGEEKSVTAIKDSVEIFLVVGDTYARVNDEDITIEVAPVNYKNKVYIPARFVGEAFGMNVTWDADTKTVSINNGTEIKSTDGKFKVIVPNDWLGLNESTSTSTAELYIPSSIQAQQMNGKVYMYASFDSSIDFKNFDSWKNILLKSYDESFEEAKFSEPSNITIGGYPALKYVVSYTNEGVNLKSCIFLVNGKSYFGKFFFNSLVSDYSNSEKVFTQIADSIVGL